MLALLGLVLAITTAGLVGCDDDNQVTTYEAPVDQAAARDEIEWELPAGWQEGPVLEQMRYATLITSDEGPALEVSVTFLEGRAGGVRANIDRWRRQLGLPPATDEDLAQQLRPFETPTGVAYIVAITALANPNSPGTSDQRLLGAVYPLATGTWFLKLTGPVDDVQAQAAAFAQFALSVRFPNAQPLPPPTAPSAPSTEGQAGAPGQPDSPSSASASDAANAGPGMPQWTLPEGWSLRAQRTSSMSIASIQAGTDAASPILEVTPLGPMAGSVLDNVNRWRRQVGLPPAATENELSPQAVETPEGPILYFHIAGAQTAMLAAIHKRPDSTWFYKLTGEPQAVAAQQEPFAAFLGSIRF